MRCAPPPNKPTPRERDTCLPFAARELDALTTVRVIVCLGAFAWDAALRLLAARGIEIPRPRPRFGHLAELAAARRAAAARLLSPQPAEHVHGQLTPAMLDEALLRARDAAGS